MKRIVILAAACAALAACSVSNLDNNSSLSDGTQFKKGQKVVLTVGTGNDTKAVGASNASDGIDFKWEKGDTIKVTVGSDSAPFVLVGEGGSATGQFEGTMPADGDKFDVQYPYGGLEKSALANQVYSDTEAIPHGMMLAKATKVAIDASFSLEPKYAVMRFDVYGKSPVGSIVVTTEESPAVTYTLDCMGSGSGTEPGIDAPKSFFIVVASGLYKFAVSVKDVSGTELDSRATAGIKGISGVTIFPPLGYPNTDEKPVTIDGTTWAPVNCGYDATNYPSGKLYQWGRAKGCGYNKAPTYTEALIQSYCDDPECSTTPDDDKFYCGGDEDKDWYSDESHLTMWPMTSTDTGYLAGKIDNPCPDGWRVPTKSELLALTANHSSMWEAGYRFTGSTIYGMGVPFVFLPAAGYRDIEEEEGTPMDRPTTGYYWSSTTSSTEAYYMTFDSASTSVSSFGRANGCSIRCVRQ